MNLKHRAFSWRPILAPALLVLAGAIFYSNTFHVPFQYDDKSSIVDNLAIRNIGHWGAIWSFWPTRFLTYFSFAVNYRFHHLDVLGFHIFNLAVHLGSGVLVWRLAQLIFLTPLMKGQESARRAGIISFFAGLIFVAHPVQTQAVTYIAQRAASMGTFFYLASMVFYMLSRLAEEEGGSSKRRNFCYAAALATAVAAMFTKEMTISLPLAVCLLEFSFFTAPGRFRARRLVPFLLLACVIPVTLLLSGSINVGEMRRTADDPSSLSPARYLLTQFRVIVTYFRLMFAPWNQNLDYDYPVAHGLFGAPALASLALLSGIVAIALRLFRKHRIVSFGILWIFLTLLPESSIVPIKDVIFEHRLYLPMAGFGFLLAGGLHDLFGKDRFRSMVVVLLALTLCFGVLTFQRNRVWRNELSLWSDVVEKSPSKARAYSNRGLAYEGRGDIPKALADYAKAIALDPRYADAFYNRGLVYQKKGDFDKALADYSKVIEINPRYAKAYNNRGLAYLAKRDFGRALGDCNKALEFIPEHPDALSNRGLVYQSKGDLGRAFVDYNLAIKIDPLCAKAYNNRGNAYLNKGDFDRAIVDYGKAIAIVPAYADAYYNRGLAHQSRGRLDEAIADYTRAVKVDPRHADAYFNRGNGYFKKGDMDHALADYNKVLEINPGDADAANNRVAALRQMAQAGKKF